MSAKVKVRAAVSFTYEGRIAAIPGMVFEMSREAADEYAARRFVTLLEEPAPEEEESAELEAEEETPASPPSPPAPRARTRSRRSRN